MLPAAALVLALCTRPPWFSTLGDACGTWHLPSEPCGCSETLTWDPNPDATPLTVYEIQRTSPGGTIVTVGRRLAQTCIGTDDTEVCNAWVDTSWWEPARDCLSESCVFPRLDAIYSYRVRACRCEGLLLSGEPLCVGLETCSLGWSNPIEYQRGEWWWCDPRQVPMCVVACYPGPCSAAPGYEGRAP